MVVAAKINFRAGGGEAFQNVFARGRLRAEAVGVERLERRFVAIDKNVRQPVAGKLPVQPRLVDLVDVDVIVQATNKALL